MERIYVFLGGPKAAMQDRLKILLDEYKKQPGKIIITGLIEEEIEFYSKQLFSININDLSLQHSWDAYSSIKSVKMLGDENALVIMAAGVYYKKRLQRILSYFKINGVILDSQEKESWSAKPLYWIYYYSLGMKIMSGIANIYR